MNSLLPNWHKSAQTTDLILIFPGLYLNDIPSFLFVEKFLLTSAKRARKPKLEKMAAGEKTNNTMYRKKQILLAEEKQMKKRAS